MRLEVLPVCGEERVLVTGAAHPSVAIVRDLSTRTVLALTPDALTASGSNGGLPAPGGCPDRVVEVSSRQAARSADRSTGSAALR